jgi:hypothetical protein
MNTQQKLLLEKEKLSINQVLPLKAVSFESKELHVCWFHIT